MPIDPNESLQSAVNEYDCFMARILRLPYWLKEAICISIHKDVCVPTSDVNVYEKNVQVFQLIKPELTFLGKRELQTKASNFNPDLYKFLRAVAKGENLTQITLQNSWSLGRTSHWFYISFCKELIEHAIDVKIPTDAAYISGNIKLGEYLQRLGIVNVEQVQRALEMQQNEGSGVLIGQIFTRLGLIKDEDIIHILKLKESAKEITMLPRFK